jgi:hypothetical protein
MINKALCQKDPAKFKEMEVMKATWWQMGLSLFSTLDELKKQYQNM